MDELQKYLYARVDALKAQRDNMNDFPASLNDVQREKLAEIVGRLDELSELAYELKMFELFGYLYRPTKG